MGASANDALAASDSSRLRDLAASLGTILARHACILVTGATTGIPGLVARTFRDH
jgi:hypothetical protein